MLKPLLVQCALAAFKAKSMHPEVFNRYNALKKRRGHKKAIIAIARMLLTAIYNILIGVYVLFVQILSKLFQYERQETAFLQLVRLSNHVYYVFFKVNINRMMEPVNYQSTYRSGIHYYFVLLHFTHGAYRSRRNIPAEHIFFRI